MAFDTYIKITGPDVEGEATAKGFEKQLEIYSFSWGASNPVTVGSGSGGLAGGKVSVSSFNFMKKSEKSSPVLFASCCTGQHHAKMVVTLNKAGGTAGQQKFILYEFDHCMVESIQWSGSTGGDDTPTESVSVAFAKCKITYNGQKPDGSFGKLSEASWDVTTVAK